MLWLIQRDFLEGKTVQAMVAEALLPVPNPFEDQDIAQVTGSSLVKMLFESPLGSFGLEFFLTPRGQDNL